MGSNNSVRDVIYKRPLSKLESTCNHQKSSFQFNLVEMNETAENVAIRLVLKMFEWIDFGFICRFIKKVESFDQMET